MSETLASKRAAGVQTDFAVDAPFPREFQLDVTERCNHRCLFCSNAKLRQRDEMPLALARRILAEAHACGARQVGLYGTGEPFMHPDFVRIVAAAKELGYEYAYIDTNGALATPERAFPALDAGLDSVKFSINAGTRASYRAVHGRDDFELVLANLRALREYRDRKGLRARLYASMVVIDRVRDEVTLLEALARPLVDEWIVRPVFNACGNNPENNSLAAIEPCNIRGRKTGARCFQPFKGFCVTAQGYLSACVLDYQRALIMADLNVTGLMDAWTSARYRELRRRHRDADLAGLICHNCVHNTDAPFSPVTPEFAKLFRGGAASEEV